MIIYDHSIWRGSVGNLRSALKGALRAYDFAEKASNTRIYNPAKNPFYTIYHYFSLWSKQHLFERAFHDLLKFYVGRRGGLSKNIVVDTSFVKNVFGSDCLGRSPIDRGRNATKVSAITDDMGTPLATLLQGARAPQVQV